MTLAETTAVQTLVEHAEKYKHFIIRWDCPTAQSGNGWFRIDSNTGSSMGINVLDYIKRYYVNDICVDKSFIVQHEYSRTQRDEYTAMNPGWGAYLPFTVTFLKEYSLTFKGNQTPPPGITMEIYAK